LQENTLWVMGMMKKAGIPQGLYYHQFFPAWKVFFEEIGAEIVFSGNTTKSILNSGIQTCVDEACLPVKVFHGHVKSLAEKVDCLIIPRLTSISKGEYICPKFGGLPDMIRHSIPHLPEIIDVEVNLRKHYGNALRCAMEIGLKFCSDRRRIKQSFSYAMQQYHIHCTPPVLKRNETANDRYEASYPTVVVMGHAYNIYDSYVNMNLLKKLQGYGLNTLMLESFDEAVINRNTNILHKKMFWNFGRKVMGSIFEIIKQKNVQGILFVTSFGCGVDSFVFDLAQRTLRRNFDIPTMLLTLDEHSGEAGLNTRIEAFSDILRWKQH
jgi:predicted nucleotide-binding protein (sugar kinase/HSP70/actin superfamily)